MVTIKGVASEYMDLKNVYGQLVDATGALNGPLFAVSQNANTYEPNAYPAVAMNNANAFVVSWNYIPPYTIPNSQLPATRGVYARLWKADGTSTNEFLVVASPHPETDPYHRIAHYYVAITQHPVGMDATGNFVVGYADETTDQTTLPKHRVRLQAYNADGTIRGGPVDIADDGNPFAFGPFQVAMAPDGTFAAAGQPILTVDDEVVAQLFRLT